MLSSGVHAVRLKGSPSVQQRVEEPASDDGADPKLVLALRGIFAVLVGLAAFVLPGVTLALLVALFGAYAVVDGVLAIIAGVRAAERHERWWSPVLKGLAGIAAGVLAFVWPALAALALLYLIAGWAIVTGVLICAGLRFQSQGRHITRFQRGFFAPFLRRCGELDGDVDGARVWMKCTCGGTIQRETNHFANEPHHDPLPCL